MPVDERSPTVLVTGGAGYIGSVLVRQLLAGGWRVRVLDSLRAGGESLAELAGHQNFEFIRGDIRDDPARAVTDCDAVVHLAAIVGDPACRAEPELARSVNLDGSIKLYEAASRSGVKRFVFASTCSNYGRAADPSVLIREDSPLRPVSLYAETKVAVEQFLLGQPRSAACIPVVLRFSTVYGVSPRMRFDLTVNEFARDVALGRELVIFGEQFWRPYCHVTDLARSAIIALSASADVVGFEVFNVGDTDENYTKQMLVDQLRMQVPALRVKFVPKSEDPRDYRVNFSKIRERLDFSPSRRVPDGIREVLEVVGAGLIADPNDKRYGNT
ncbi:MAG: NAD-dependent epimerase/dehydratase family protein [Gemmatimonadota bacterium]|nr:NAD-dependent epimerase/dehydratase family protein [Gemmatimonadota bacterium]